MSCEDQRKVKQIGPDALQHVIRWKNTLFFKVTLSSYSINLTAAWFGKIRMRCTIEEGHDGC